MIPFISKLKTLSLVIEPFIKPQILSVLPSPVFHSRAFHTDHILLIRNRIHRNPVEPDLQSLYDPKDLGKVIDLGETFEDFELPDRTSERNKKKKEASSENKKITKNTSGTQRFRETDENANQKKDKLKNNENTGKISKKWCIENYSRLFSEKVVKLKSKKGRENNKQIILEGKRLIHDALSVGFTPSMVFYTRASDLEKLSLPNSVETFKVAYKTFKLYSDVTTSQGILGIFPMPDPKSIKISETVPLIVICDNIRDPGNLGSILRVAASIGCENIMLTQGCVEIWEPKVLRSAAGAQFHIPITCDLTWQNIENLIDEKSKVFLADFKNCFRKNQLTSNVNSNNTNDDQVEDNFSVFQRKSDIMKNLPLECYHSLKHENQNTVMVIGGETHGLSEEAYEFGVKRNGTRVYIPMSNRIESLNNSVALGILGYEFRRQLHLKNQTESQQKTQNDDSQSNI